LVERLTRVVDYTGFDEIDDAIAEHARMYAEIAPVTE
jgi:hypothetical protein